MSDVDERPAAHCIVLLVEDEPIIRMVASEVLTEAGFTVLEATNGEEALALLAAQPGLIHVLFTDIHMPGVIDGLNLAHRARKQWPWVGILIASGRARPAALDLPAGSRFVAKPYEPDHVVSHVRDLATAC